jgi:hypothetical protein
MEVKKENVILFSGGAEGAEAEFGANAERFGVEEVNFTFEGHVRGRQRGVRILNREELKNGDVSLEYVSKLMNRRYTQSPILRKVLQSIWYQINNGQGIYVVGEILPDKTVKGGTGWGAEFAKICNKPLFVFDQKREGGRTGDQPSPFRGDRHEISPRERQEGDCGVIRANLRIKRRGTVPLRNDWTGTMHEKRDLSVRGI